MMFDAFTFCLVALQICWIGLGLISLAPNSAKQRQAAPSCSLPSARGLRTVAVTASRWLSSCTGWEMWRGHNTKEHSATCRDTTWHDSTFSTWSLSQFESIWVIPTETRFSYLFMELNGWTRSPPNLCCLSECHRLLVLWHKRLPDPTFWRQEWERGDRTAPRVSCASCAPSIDLLFTDHRQTWIGIERCRRLQLARVAWSIGVIVWADGPGLSDRFFWLFSRSVEARIHTTSRSAEGKHYVFICFHRFSNQAPCHHSASLLRPQNAGVSWYGNRASNVLGLKRKEWIFEVPQSDLKVFKEILGSERVCAEAVRALKL